MRFFVGFAVTMTLPPVSALQIADYCLGYLRLKNSPVVLPFFIYESVLRGCGREVSFEKEVPLGRSNIYSTHT